jgi:hypothetical protein
MKYRLKIQLVMTIIILSAFAGFSLAEPPDWAGEGGIRAALEACEADLAACQELPCTTLPGDGYTGAPLSYTENGDGTFTDDNTGLMWEIKTLDGSIHDYNNVFSWTATGVDPDGTVFSVFLMELNSTGFAGYSDWRIPTVKELQSLVDYSQSLPAISPDLPGVMTGVGIYYWTSTPAVSPSDAWFVHFDDGIVNANPKFWQQRVRAVRSEW